MHNKEKKARQQGAIFEALSSIVVQAFLCSSKRKSVRIPWNLQGQVGLTVDKLTGMHSVHVVQRKDLKDYPVELESRVLQVKSLLNMQSDDGVCIVGIHGIGGIGKTTLAKEVYNSIANQFKVLCFLDAVREKTQKLRLVHLQETLLHETTGEKDVKLGSVSKGISIIKQRLQKKKVLLILDDVDDLKQLQAMVGDPRWFGLGSRVMVTTRDTQLLASHGIEWKYEVEELNEKEALELLRCKVFKDNKADSNYEHILKHVVTYASGLPLALEVIGSTLSGKRHIVEWKSLLSRYERIPHKDIQKILQVSYDALAKEEQSVFLDIACCFKGYELSEVERLLCAHYGECMKCHIQVLVEKSLLKIDRWLVTLHDFIEAMGKEVVRQESHEEPGKRSRLWFHEDILQVLEDFTNFLNIKELNFKNCEYLVQIHDVSGLTNLENFSVEGCKNLNTIHDSVGFHLNKLKIFNAQDCSKLKNFPPLKLTSLMELMLSRCKSLKSFPEILGEMKNLTSIELLDTSIENLPFSFRNLIGLENVMLQGSGKLRLSRSIVMMPKLSSIHVFGHSQLLLKHNDNRKSMVSSNVTSITLGGCKSLDVFLPMLITWFTNLTELNLTRGKFTILPECLKECLFLNNLDVMWCKSLQEIRGIPPNLRTLCAKGCYSLSSLCKRMLLNQDLHENGGTYFSFSGAVRMPEWFEHQSKGPSISFWFRNKVPSISLCSVFNWMDHNYYYIYLDLSVNGCREYCITNRLRVQLESYNSLVLMDLQLELEDSENEWVHVEVRFVLDDLGDKNKNGDWEDVELLRRTEAQLLLIKSGIHAFEQKNNMEDIRFTNPYKKRKVDEYLNTSPSHFHSLFGEGWVSVNCSGVIEKSL